MITDGLGSVGGDIAEGLGENAGDQAPVVSPPAPSSGIVSYGGGSSYVGERHKRRRQSDLPYSKDTELQEARRELRKLAFYLHPDRTIDLDEKARREYEELLRLATIEYHAQVERVKKHKKRSAAFDKLRTQLRIVTARLEQLELEMTALRAETQTLRREVATLRGTTATAPVVVKSRWAWPLFIGVLIGALATMLVGAWRTRVKTEKRKRKNASAQAHPSKRKTRSRRQQRPRSRSTSRRQAARAHQGH